jgi:hypothetical protein
MKYQSMLAILILNGPTLRLAHANTSISMSNLVGKGVFIILRFPLDAEVSHCGST